MGAKADIRFADSQNFLSALDGNYVCSQLHLIEQPMLGACCLGP